MYLKEILSLPYDSQQTEFMYYVSEGTVKVYISSRIHNQKGKPAFLCSASKGTLLPPLMLKNHAHDQWYFTFLPEGSNSKLCLTDIPATISRKQEFLKNTRVFEKNAFLQAEDPDQCLYEWYRYQSIRTETQTTADADGKKQGIDKKIHLDGLNSYDTANVQLTSIQRKWLHVESGSVNIYVIRRNGETIGKPLHLATVSAGSWIPAVGFKSRNHDRWGFRLRAAENQAVIVLTAQEPAAEEKNRFLEASTLHSTIVWDDASMSSLNDAIVDWYQQEILKPIQSKREPKLENELYQTSDYSRSENSLFRAVSYACECCGIQCCKEEELLTAYDMEQITVNDIGEVSHFICREVELEKNWWKYDCGPIIGTIQGKPISCIPGFDGKYTIFYSENQKTEKLTPKIAAEINETAYCIGRTLPARSLMKKDLWDFCVKYIKKSDLAFISMLALFGALISALIPILNQKIYDDYVPLGNYSQMIQLCIMIGGFMLGSMFFDMVKNLSTYRVSSKIGFELQNATIYRSFFLPESFFRKYESADLTNRMFSVDGIVDTYSNCIIVSGLSFLFSVVYLIKMFRATAKLTWVALAILLIAAFLFYWLSIRACKYEYKIQGYTSEADSRLLQYLCAIDKVRMAGAEERALKKYILPVKKSERLQISKNFLISFKTALRGITVTIISMVFYYIMIKKNVKITVGNFTAFNSALGMFAGTLLGLIDSIIQVRLVQPLLQRLNPIYQAETEYFESDQESKSIIHCLNGPIEIRDLCFRYSETGPMILKGLNMKIESGEYVGIVGRSGCGKSTLLKLLLGFENPTSGIISYAGNNLRKMDKRSFRRRLGVVLQNERLVQGTILENITITNPNASMEEVRNAVAAAGLEEDIAEMPMNLMTPMNAYSTTISGGQRQRILIARAILGKPEVVLLDEATSALDNITQKVVCDSLDHLHSTRIVIAHRLSTIKNCDKIYVMDQGKIEDQGTYDELMSHRGLFYEMAVRQLVEGEAYNEN